MQNQYLKWIQKMLVLYILDKFVWNAMYKHNNGPVTVAAARARVTSKTSSISLSNYFIRNNKPTKKER